jgi:hypothetical protein
MVKNLIKQIEDKYAGDRVPRQRLGLSEIGHHCPRYLWYAHRGIQGKPIEGRILRLFQHGNMVESGVIADLRSIGWEITDQQREVSITDQGITLRGHVDGTVNKDHLLEIKSANDKSFKALMKLMSYENWNLKYKAQAHTYMALLNLKKCIVVVENKNDSNLYIEEITLDADYVTKLLIDVFAAINSPEPPVRTCPDASWFKAKFCPLSKVCF